MQGSALKNFVYQSAILSLTVAICFIWTNAQILSNQNLFVIALMVIIYIASQIISRYFPAIFNNKTIIETTILTFVIFLIVFSTGGLSSPVFFLVYFLLFGISLLLQPMTAGLVSLVVIGFFLLTPKTDLFAELLQLGSLLIISPLAIIFGKQYIKLSKSEQNVSILKQKENNLNQEITRQENQVKNWASNDLTKRLWGIQKDLTSIMQNPQVPLSEKQRLNKIFRKVYNVFLSSKKMDDKIQE